MRLPRTWMPLSLMLLLAVGPPTYSAEPDSGQEAAIAAIRKLGGEVRVVQNKVLVSVRFFRNSPDTDAGLRHVKGLTRLEHLDVAVTNITDAGLEHLKGLNNLRTLYLTRTNVTDAGLVHLKGLTKLQTLNLESTNVSDAGMEHLKGLIKLEHLDLRNTKVTDEGVKKLRKALPNCKIVR